MKTLLTLAGLLAVALADAAAAPEPDIDYWQVPWENSRPRDPDVDHNGLVWFVGQTGDYVASFDPKNEQFRKIDLDAGTGPHNLIVGEDRRIWYTGNRAAHLGRVDGGSGVIEKIPTPQGVRDPHTMIGDGKGHIWFTAQGANYIGRLTLAGRKMEVVQPPVKGALPYGIALDQRGRPWVNLLGSNRLATVNPQTMEVETYELPRKDARTRRIAIGAGGAIWYTDYAKGYIGRFDPQTGKFDEWLPPTGEKARPYAMALDARGRVWFSDTGAQPNRLMAFDPQTEQFVVNVELDNARGAVRHMVYHEPSKALWFGTDTDYLVRVQTENGAED